MNRREDEKLPTDAVTCPVCGTETPQDLPRRNARRRATRCDTCRRPLTVQGDAPALDVVGLQHNYGSGPTAVHAVKGLDLTVNAGEVVLVVGPSGGGKTTALLAMGLLLTPTAGSVSVGGVEGTTMGERERATHRLLEIGFVFQQFNLMPALSAVQNVALPLRYAGVRRRPAEERAKALLESFDLGHRLRNRPAELSGGEKQRVAVARAMVAGPRLVLADEPTANLDSKTGHLVAEQMVKAARAEKSGVVIVTHDTRLADAADRVTVLEDGVLRAGQAADMIGTP